MIPIVRPTLFDFEEVAKEFRQAWESGQITTGTFTRQFEQAVEEKLQVPHAVMVSSCTSGLMLVLRALEAKGEVILPAFTWTATALAVLWNGLTPVFADIKPGNYTLDPEAVVRAITPRTVAIMPVNVFGCPPDYMAFAQLAEKFQIPLVYDSAQSLGSRYQTDDGSWHYGGRFGNAEVFSLSPTKVVSGIEGGLITTHDPKLAQKLVQMRDYGKTMDAEDISELGLSVRVPEINAIVARHNFQRMDKLVARRRQLISFYRESLGELPGVTYQKIPSNCTSSGNYFVIFIGEAARLSRDEVCNRLKEMGIQAKKYFFPALHRQRVYEDIGKPYLGKLPVTEAAAASGLALPLYSHMTVDTILQVCEAVKEILG
jgi:dTDP-4-amino-4,6-dideoxygalactose transaminase